MAFSSTASGGSGNDRIPFTTFPNAQFRAYGEEGDDILVGGGNTDRLDGGSGDDLLIAGASEAQFTTDFEFLAGGSGNDVFRYDSAAESTASARDSIRDFSLGDPAPALPSLPLAAMRPHIPLG